MAFDSFKLSASRAASRILAFLQGVVNRIVSADTRQMTYARVVRFSTESPILASFIFAQVLFSFIPFLIFLTFTISTALFALSAAVVFSLFWLGIGLIVLAPTLLLTSSIAVAVFAWALCSYFFVRQVSGWLPRLEGTPWERRVVAPAPVNGERSRPVKTADGAKTQGITTVDGVSDVGATTTGESDAKAEIYGTDSKGYPDVVTKEGE
ncbi:uncharacterized protein DNG_01773 [Cephalotrichum gorgonifer]|uniref:Uncharacterized protein n=1 Tax=Cephalotrichum gorgonifer TaxID=2041049 RepID=A0AAE8MRI5_9PEZI|nr:uncharacterized protein DNG_01773 [Cephalotrichum gorgonifer]